MRIKWYYCCKDGEEFDPNSDALQESVAGAELIAQMVYGDLWKNKNVVIRFVYILLPDSDKMKRECYECSYGGCRWTEEGNEEFENPCEYIGDKCGKETSTT